MNIERQQELISAYLDGELTGDEQTAAEALLAESEDARRWLEELRGLQSRVRELPKFSLGADFSQAVLDQAERAMLSGAGVGVAAGGDSDDNEEDSDETAEDHDLHVFYAERDQVDRAAARRRRIVWSVLAVAAALLIMVVLPQPKPKDTVQRDHQADSPEAKTAVNSTEGNKVEADRFSAGQAGTGGADRNLSVSAANESADVVRDDRSATATVRKNEPEDLPRRGLLQEPAKVAKALEQDEASAVNADQPVAGATVGRAADQLNRAAAPDAAQPAPTEPALGAASDAVDLQIAADYDGIAVFEMDVQSAAGIDGLKLARNADVPADEALSNLRRLPLDKLAELRAAPVADEAEEDQAKAKDDAAEQIYWGIVQGTSDEIKLKLAKLQTPAKRYQPIQMNPQLALSLGEFGSGNSLAGVYTNSVGDAKKQAVQADGFGGGVAAEAPAASGGATARPKPAPTRAPAEKPAAPTRPDKADAKVKLRINNGTPEQDASRDLAEAAPAGPPLAPSLALEKNRATDNKSRAEAEELAKRVVESFARSEFRSRQQAQRELEAPISEAASAADFEKTSDEQKDGKQVADKETKPTEKRKRPKIAPQPAPTAPTEPSEELPTVQPFKGPGAAAGKTYRVLVVVSVK